METGIGCIRPLAGKIEEIKKDENKIVKVVEEETKTEDEKND
jgi:hypothetical protein